MLDYQLVPRGLRCNHQIQISELRLWNLRYENACIFSFACLFVALLLLPKAMWLSCLNRDFRVIMLVRGILSIWNPWEMSARAWPWPSLEATKLLYIYIYIYILRHMYVCIYIYIYIICNMYIHISLSLYIYI